MGHGDAARAHYEELKELVKSGGWTKVKANNEVTLESKPMNGISIECYRATGASKKSPKDLADKAMAMTDDDWKKFDPSIIERKTVTPGDEVSVLYQSHSLAWPCASRDLVLEHGRFTDSDGSEYIVFRTVDVGHPPKDKFVRANCLISGFVFLADPATGGSKIVRIVQVDPCGSIPAFIVNSQASSFMNDVAQMMKW